MLVPSAQARDAAAVTAALVATLEQPPEAVAREVREAIAACRGSAVVLVAIKDKLVPAIAKQFEAAILVLEALAGVYEREGNQKGAVEALKPHTRPRGNAPLPDSTIHRASLRLAEVYLFFDEAQLAEGELTALSKNNIRYAEDQMLRARHSFCTGQVQAHRGRLAEAAQRFYDFSFSDPSQAVESLELAATCAVAAEPSDLRARVVATVLGDDRARLLSPPLLAALHTVQARRFLREADAAAVRPKLPQQHRGTTLEHSIRSHNVLAAAGIYANISISRLAALIGASGAEAETIAIALISDGRLSASIDQVSGIITVHSDRDAAAHRRERSIGVTCAELSKAFEVVTARA